VETRFDLTGDRFGTEWMTPADRVWLNLFTRSAPLVVAPWNSLPARNRIVLFASPEAAAVDG